MHALVNIALRAARDVADDIAQSSDRLDRVKVLPSEHGQLLTSVDVDANKSLLYHLQKTYPDHGFVSRVSGEVSGKDGQPIWLMDPLAGNRNFMNGYGQYALSLACVVDNRIEHAVIVNPLSRDEFIASRGSGAQLNGRRIRVSPHNDIKAALIGLDEEGLATESFQQLQSALFSAGAHPRISGCPALDLAAAACGHLQGGCCGPYDPVTLAAATLILQEAGGFVGSETGSPEFKSARQLLFGNQKTFRGLVNLCN